MERPTRPRLTAPSRNGPIGLRRAARRSALSHRLLHGHPSRNAAPSGPPSGTAPQGRLWTEAADSVGRDRSLDSGRPPWKPAAPPSGEASIDLAPREASRAGGQFRASDTELDSPKLFDAVADTLAMSSNTPSSKVKLTVAVNWLPKLADWLPEK